MPSSPPRLDQIPSERSALSEMWEWKLPQTTKDPPNCGMTAIDIRPVLQVSRSGSV